MHPSISKQRILRQYPTSRKVQVNISLSLHNNHFHSKVKSYVRSLLQVPPDFNRVQDSSINGLSQVTDTSNPTFLRIAWGILLNVCIAICVFQVQDRISYYLSEPVVVDVNIKQDEFVKFPSITIASAGTIGAARILKQNNVTVTPVNCAIPLKLLFETVQGFEASKLWPKLNLTPSIIEAVVFNHDEPHNVSFIEEIGLYGTQARFELDEYFHYDGMESNFFVKVRKEVHSCKSNVVMGSIQENTLPSDKKNTFLFKTLTSNDLLVGFKKFHFLNRRNQACTDNAAYFECWRRCTVEKFKNLPCRFPFIPEELKMPSCISGPGVGNLYGQTLVTFWTFYCKCPRRCHETAFDISMRFVESRKDDTIINMYLVSNQLVIISERFAYDIISLLSEIGGTLGLCLGLSILSLIQTLQNLALTMIKSSQNKRKKIIKLTSKDIMLFRTDPIRRRVKHVLIQELYIIHNRQQQMKKLRETTSSTRWQFMRVIVVTGCIIGSCLFIYLRVSTYLYVPTRMTVQIVHKDAVHFPNLTVCGLSMPIATRLKKLAKNRHQFRNTSFNPRMDDWCALQLTDLLDELSAEEVWDQSSIFQEHETSLDIGKMLFNRSFAENVLLREVTLPSGKCVEICPGEQPFSGTRTQYSRAIQSAAFYLFEKELIECDRHYQEMFITPPNEFLDLRTRLVFPTGLKTSFIFDSKKVTFWNTDREPCVGHEEAKECHKHCFHAVLEKSISCRLPYMPPSVKHLQMCSTSRSANLAHATYVKLSLTFDSLHQQDCGCIKSCTRNIVTSSMFIEPHSFPNVTVLYNYFFNNIYEHIVEVPAYSLTSLLCDIGGNLGITLGASLLSILDLVQAVLTKLKTDCRKKFAEF